MFPAQKTIVVVDDDPGVGAALERTLTICGYHTELFASSAECLNAAATTAAACFVIDVHLGNDFGIDLSTQLSAMGIKSPIIHMSGAGTEAVRQEALASGSTAFLDKPFTMEELLGAIERAINGR